MNVHSRFRLLFLALGVGIFSAACSSSSSPTSASAAVPQAGATIQGTVVGSVAGSGTGLHSLSTQGGIRVSVSGTSLAAMTDSSGKFVLAGVPSGQVELRFQGQGVDARLDVSGLATGQTLTITVNITGGQATLMPDQDDKNTVDFKGAIQSIDPGAGTLMVAGRKVVTNSSTRITSDGDATLTLSALKVGAMVEVHGSTLSDNSVLATNINLEQAEGGDKGEVDLKGAIQSIDMGGLSLMVSGRKVVTGANTRITGQDDVRLTLSDLKVGATVAVHGTAQADGSVLAQTIQLQGNQGDDGHEVELHGRIQSINLGAGTLMVAGKTVATDPQTHILGARETSLMLKDLKVNDSVEVTGTSRADGTVLAKEIRLDQED
jgi:hypothetical protein